MPLRVHFNLDVSVSTLVTHLDRIRFSLIVRSCSALYLEVNEEDCHRSIAHRTENRDPRQQDTLHGRISSGNTLQQQAPERDR